MASSHSPEKLTLELLKSGKPQPELLTPAGSESAFKAAIIAGADAIYFGVEQFNARRRAENISLEKLPELISIASAHGVKTYLTLNILLYDDEIAEALRVVDKAVKAGISAVIIQDLGILSVLQQKFPSLELHASTQMTTHNLSQCRFLLTEGVSQVNLSRELSLLEIKPLATFLSSNGIRPEIFVHGAFCISYSGQCYLSEHLYDEPGNRGQCVQPCRRKYVTLLETNNSSEGSNTSERCNTSNSCRTLESFSASDRGNNSVKSYPSSVRLKPFAPFNLKDNCLYPDISTLLEAVPNASLKIEGRIKSAQYVWAVTSAWREKLDELKNVKKLENVEKLDKLDKYNRLDKCDGLDKFSRLDKCNRLDKYCELDKCDGLDKFSRLDKCNRLDKYCELDKCNQSDKFFAPEKLTKSMNRGLTDGYFVGQISGSMFGSGSKDESLENIGKVVRYTASTAVLEIHLNPELYAENNHAINTPEKAVTTDYTFTASDKTTTSGNSFNVPENTLKKGDHLSISGDEGFICTAIVKSICSISEKAGIADQNYGRARNTGNPHNVGNTLRAGNAFETQKIADKANRAFGAQGTGNVFRTGKTFGTENAFGLPEKTNKAGRAFGAGNAHKVGNAFSAQETADKTDCAVIIQITGKLNGRIKPGNTVMRKPELISDEELARLTDKLGVPQKDNLIPLKILVFGKNGEKLQAVFEIQTSVASQNSDQSQNSNRLQNSDQAQNSNQSQNSKQSQSSNRVEILSTSVLQPAQNRSLSKETLNEKFSRLGGTDFCFDSLDCKQLDSGLFLPLTELNDMRRRAVEQLSKVLSDSRSRTEELVALADKLLPADKLQPVSELVPADKLLPADKLQPASELTQADKLAPVSEFAPQKQLVLCAGISAATELLSKGKLPVLEIPLFKADDAQTEYSQFLVDNPEVIPLFQPVLFESDLDMAIKLLESISGAASTLANNTLKRPIWCENIGLALEASERGFPVIIGQQLNITNSYTVSELCHRLNVCAIVPSLELSAEKLCSLKSNVPILYPLTENRLLMQSRQCLVRNIPVQGKLCSKTETDRDCIFTCSRCSIIYPYNETQFNTGNQVNSANQFNNGNCLQVIKRPGFYSGVFTEFDARKKSDYAELKKAVSIWFTDNRFVEAN